MLLNDTTKTEETTPKVSISAKQIITIILVLLSLVSSVFFGVKVTFTVEEQGQKINGIEQIMNEVSGRVQGE